ncbi:MULTISPECIES: sensor histidine kinase [Reichenbachiella]|uniref:Signal transduction histidine kinase n=1 Tax=Reichenbachiella agariperforans TaxID=156994 RepID=A0A1M6NHA9_REIAG|nr:MULTISPECIES: ATP-binding protein [Reichenbachiella]MBU2915880.1 hypothetical protein [Reichenbachiella agariperforans]RJE71862.1 hypothetical protein BGP76_07180 [Reichenbachiella sp. MSK19-1]SHJ95118.1 Signal transduction histidine kinase [Reichenbachiella agariperforans]
MESQSSQLNVEMVLILGTSGMLFLVTSIVLFIYLYQRKLIKKKLEYQEIEDLLKKQELKSAYAMLAGKDKAYREVAEELHDNLGSMLVTLNMLSDTIPQKTDPASLNLIAKKISEVATKATEATRQISHSLHSEALMHFGLASAIHELAGALNESHTISVHVEVQITTELEGHVSLNLYRIIQELVNNTLKHAKAKNLNIDVSEAKGHLNVIFEDDGIGMVNVEEYERGLGLKNIKSRVAKLEGQITMESGLGRGTTCIIDIPL